MTEITQASLCRRNDVERYADAYVYVITVERSTDSKEFYYVGSVNAGQKGAQALAERLRTHYNGTSRITGPKKTEYGPIRLSDYRARRTGEEKPTFAATNAVRVESIQQHDGEDNYVRDCRMKALERKVAFEVAIDHDTTHVLGGK